MDNNPIPRSEDPRFKPHGPSDNRRFDAYPTRGIIEELREHVRQTGCPDTWRFHTHNAPIDPKELPEVIANGIDVPERFRALVGEAPCPLCSLKAPKYFKGMLAWWRGEQCLRVIGHECGGKFWGERWEAAIMDARKRTSDDRAQDYLFAALPAVSALRRWAHDMQVRAEYFDLLRLKLLKGLTKGVARAIYRASSGGLPLLTYRTEWRTMVDSSGFPKFDDDGKLVKKPERAEEWGFYLRGRDAMSPKAESAQAFAIRANNILASLEFGDEDAILAALIAMDAPGRIAADATLRQANVLLHRVYFICSAIQEFMGEENITNLMRWIGDTDSISARGHFSREGLAVFESTKGRGIFNLQSPLLVEPLSEPPSAFLPVVSSQRKAA